MKADDVVKVLAEIGESCLWTLLILVVLLIIVTSRADKE